MAGACFLSCSRPADARAQGRPSGARRRLRRAAELAVLPSPLTPWRGAPLRVIFAAEKPLDGELSLIAPDGSVAARSRERHGGPPYFWFAEVKSPAAGTWRATLTRDRAPAGCGTITRDIAVRADEPPPPSAAAGSVWPLRNAWSRATENLFSAWIEKLFDAPLDEEPSWPALHVVLRDRSRNFLFNHLGLGEDEMKMVLASRLRRPAVFPARLFRVQDGAAVRLLEVLARRRRPGAALPAVVQHSEPRSAPPCRRVSRNRPSAPRDPSNARAPSGASPRAPAQAAGACGGVRPIFADVADAVHSGSGRTAAADNNTDYYPVSLKQDTLRPGTVYADPYGHVLMIVRRVAQSAARPASFSPSTASPTARSRASASGAAISCSRRIPRSAAPASSASARSCATRAARCGG